MHGNTCTSSALIRTLRMWRTYLLHLNWKVVMNSMTSKSWLVNLWTRSYLMLPARYSRMVLLLHCCEYCWQQSQNCTLPQTGRELRTKLRSFDNYKANSTCTVVDILWKVTRLLWKFGTSNCKKLASLEAVKFIQRPKRHQTGAGTDRSC